MIIDIITSSVGVCFSAWGHHSFGLAWKGMGSGQVHGSISGARGIYVRRQKDGYGWMDE
jgi:hypothetical protein